MASKALAISATTSLPNYILIAASGSVVPKSQFVKFPIILQERDNRLICIMQQRGRGHKSILKPICATASGLETSVGDSEGSSIMLRKVEISIESQDADKMSLRVDLPAVETQKVFDVLLSKLARSAPATPGFRQQKGGKTSKIPKNLLLNILGKDLVMKFIIREIVTSAVANYVKEKNINVRDGKIKTTQTEDELKQSFVPGNPFGFNVDIELVTEEPETDSTDSQE